MTRVRTFWSLLALETLEQAVSSLQEREGIPDKNKDRHIGKWTPGLDGVDEDLAKWAANSCLDAIVWTALPPKFNDKEGLCPSEDQVVTYLRDLQHNRRKHAESYIRRTPRQIDTRYRRRIEKELGWTPAE
jgi:hypothetical protein